MPLLTVNSVENPLVSETIFKSEVNFPQKKIVIISLCPGHVPGVSSLKYTHVASRTLIVRELKGLQDIIGKTVVHYHMTEQGWRFVESENECEGATPEKLYGSKYLRELYFRAQPDYEGRFTVPLLWDKKTETIVNNESRYDKF
jgi:hypothetical protein